LKKEVIGSMLVLILAAVCVFAPLINGVVATLRGENVTYGARPPRALVLFSIALAVSCPVGFVVIGALGQPLDESIVYWGLGGVFLASGELLCLLGCSEYGYHSKQSNSVRGGVA
jgi:hypothetical protein